MILDTNIIIDALQEGGSVRGGISIISLLEIIRGIPSEKRATTKALLEQSHLVFQIENDVILKYAEIYNKLKDSGTLIPDADLIIGATAIVKNLVLNSSDKHFKRLEPFGLNLYQ